MRTIVSYENAIWADAENTMFDIDVTFSQGGVENTDTFTVQDGDPEAHGQALWALKVAGTIVPDAYVAP